MDENETFSIDFERYWLALRKWYRLIILSTLVVGAIALGLSFLSSAVYQSEAVVAIVKSGVQVNFDPKITTTTDVNSVDPTARRKSLTAIATSPDIATTVFAKIGDQLPSGQTVTALSAAVKAVNNGDDLIHISATAATSSTAALIANTWADEYTTRVNIVYGETTVSPDEIQNQANVAKKDYDAKEAALITYLAINPNDALARQIAEKQQVLQALQSGKDTALKTVVDKEIESRSQIIAAYISAQSNNRLVAFNKEQEEKTKLLTAFLDQEINNRLTAVSKDYAAKTAIFNAYADNLIQSRVAAFQKEQDAKTQLFNAYAGLTASGQVAVINKQVDAKINQLSSYYTEQAKLRGLSTEAKSLRDRIQSGSSASQSSATANSLAIILLQASAFTTGAGLPVNLQIPMNQITDLNATPDQQLRDLNLLIEVLDSKLRDTNLSIDQLSRSLQSSDGYQLQPITATINSSVEQTVKQTYDAMLQVGPLTQYSDMAVVNSDLSNALLKKYNELFGVGELTKIAVATPFTSTLSAVIQQNYPELFQTGALAQLSDDVSPNNPLALTAEEKSQALLQLNGFENVIQYSSTNEPITKAEDQLQQEVNQLQSQLESESAKKQELVRARDLAWSTYTTLANKIAEMGVSAQVSGSVVRVATPAVPSNTTTGTGKSTKTLIGLFIGFLLGVGLVLGIEFFHPTIRNENQVNKLLGLSVLGAIPEMTQSKLKSKSGTGPVSANLVALDTRSPVTEAYRVLRRKFATIDPAWRVIAVTSATPSEGKSTVAANLAVTVAQTGKRVVLVDADFRRPAQHKLFGARNNQGLFDILSGGVEKWEAFAQTTSIANLRLVTSGALPSDPVVLLESPHLKRWLTQLKSSVDWVILDTPPAIGLADALVVAQAADATLLVVGVDLVSEKDGQHAKELLTSASVPVVGVVLNRTEQAPEALTYAYYYARRKEPVAEGTAEVPINHPSMTQNLFDRFLDFMLPRKYRR